MLTDAGCEWVSLVDTFCCFYLYFVLFFCVFTVVLQAIVGHSERRQLQNESSALVANKAKNALDNGLGVVVCIGETKKERDAGKLEKVTDF